ncbi:hypothetical protein BDW74DRAFT_183551 [Aspergillus multicolor]|uniref:uncharacterized protein n=1 Tax=Aspergillus multicolor TaxID=41759 RepID=UPI003CCD07DC
MAQQPPKPRVTWNDTTNIKLFHGTLKILHGQKIRIPSKALAQYMGPEYTAKSIDHQLVKLKKEALAAPPQA